MKKMTMMLVAAVLLTACQQGPKVTQQAFGCLRVLSAGIGQAGIGIEADARAKAGQLLDKRYHLRHIGHAVDADGIETHPQPLPVREGR